MPTVTTRPAAHGAAHNTALDGLRCLSFLAVFAHHAYPYKVPFGGAGVTVFFVLSGFLIGRILLSSAERSDVSLWERLRVFYARRALRIFPLYYAFLLLIALAPLAGVNVLGDRSHLPWHALYQSNLRVAMLGAWNPPQAHFWTLSVEEHFYLIAPLLLLTLPLRKTVALLVAAFVLGNVGRMVAVLVTPGALWAVLSPFCFDGMALGVLVAVMERRESIGPLNPDSLRRVGRGGGGALALLSLPLLYAPGAVKEVAGALLTLGVTLYAASLVFDLWHGRRDLGAARLLSHPALVYAGRISYGLYVFHNFALFAWCFASPSSGGLNHALRVIAALITTVIAAALSWHLFEGPINGLKRHFRYPTAGTGRGGKAGDHVAPLGGAVGGGQSIGATEVACGAEAVALPFSPPTGRTRR